jgi:hypothetical protein
VGLMMLVCGPLEGLQLTYGRPGREEQAKEA